MFIFLTASKMNWYVYVKYIFKISSIKNKDEIQRKCDLCKTNLLSYYSCLID